MPYHFIDIDFESIAPTKSGFHTGWDESHFHCGNLILTIVRGGVQHDVERNMYALHFSLLGTLKRRILIIIYQNWNRKHEEKEAGP